jgi:thiamine-phosphate pyrophosphorylase
LGGRELETIAAAAAEGGAAAVHLREPDLPAAGLYALAVRLRRVTAGRCALVINDRVDVALAVAADAVQLGGQALPVAAARHVAGARLQIGRSVHDVEEAVEAEHAGADYLLLGTLFATRSHPDRVPAGPEIVTRVRAATRLPIVGIGGITAANAGIVIAAGAEGVAAISVIQDAGDVAAATKELVDAVEDGRSGARAFGRSG